MTCFFAATSEESGASSSSDMAAMEVVEMVASMDGVVSDVDKTKIKITLKEMSPELSRNEVSVISEIVQEVGPNLDLEVMKKVLRRPVGPAIGFVSQFLFLEFLKKDRQRPSPLVVQIVDGDEACGLFLSWPLLQSVVVLMPLQKAIR